MSLRALVVPFFFSDAEVYFFFEILSGENLKSVGCCGPGVLPHRAGRD